MKGCFLVTDAQIEAYGEAMAKWGAAQEREKIQWPNNNRVSRIEDMGIGKLTVGLDSDFDVYVNAWDGHHSATVEFCNPGGGGGGRSSKTRVALIKLMQAIELDNAARPLEAHQGD